MKGLDRIVVLDFSRLLPGPFCTMQLADLGCRVIRVELPHWRDPVRDIPPMIGPHGFCYWMVNRNKESLSIDFRKPEGLEIVMKLLKKSDVLVEGSRPGLMQRIGLGPKELCRRFPRLIYCSITGYGQEGPMSAKAGHDINFLAQSGIMGLGDSNGGVSFPPVQVADFSGSMYASLAILAALHERNVTRKGQHLDIAMAETVFSWQVLALGHYFASGNNPGQKSRWWNGSSPFYRPYRTKDGRYLAIGALERGLSSALLQAIGRSDLESQISGDDFGANSAELIRSLESAFVEKPLDEWLRIFEDKDVCATAVLTPEEAARHPFFTVRKSATVEGGAAVPAGIANPMRFSRSKVTVRRLPPGLGQDNASVLRSFGIKAKRS